MARIPGATRDPRPRSLTSSHGREEGVYGCAWRRYSRLLGLGRERVVGVDIVGEGEHQEVIVDLARRERRRMRCSRCGRSVRAVYDRSTRSWRHLDLMRVRCTLRCEVRRIDCPECGVVAEQVPWARSGSRFTRGFEDTCVWLVRAAPRSSSPS